MKTTGFFVHIAPKKFPLTFHPSQLKLSNQTLKHSAVFPGVAILPRISLGAEEYELSRRVGSILGGLVKFSRVFSVKFYPDLAHVREKPFPYYESWVEIYGRDGATGNGAFDFNSMPLKDGAGNGVKVTEETNTNNPNACCSENPTQTQSASPKSSTKRAVANGKCKRVEDVSEIIGTIDTMWGRATDALNKVANVLERDVDTKVDVQAAANRRRLYDTINDLPLSLTRLEKVRATSELGSIKIN